MTASADRNDEYKSSAKPAEVRPGFLDQKILDNLTVTLDGEEIKIFSSPHFLATLQRQATDSMQSEPLTFLQEIYKVNQLNLSTADLEAETGRLVDKYINNPNDPNYLNIGTSGNFETFIKLMREGKMLASFEPLIIEMCTLIKTNMGRPITLFTENRTMLTEEVKKQLHDAYQQDKQDKLLFPARSVICSALEGINTTFRKLATQPIVLSEQEKQKQVATLLLLRRSDTLVTESLRVIRGIQFELQELLKETITVTDISLPHVQEKISKILDACGTLQTNSEKLNMALGKPNSRSRKINDFLGPLTAAKEWHAILILDPNTLDSKERTEKESLKNSSLFLCQTESNIQTVAKYMKYMKTGETPLQRQSSSVLGMLTGRRQP